jgi:hypothetical protein
MAQLKQKPRFMIALLNACAYKSLRYVDADISIGRSGRTHPLDLQRLKCIPKAKVDTVCLRACMQVSTPWTRILAREKSQKQAFTAKALIKLVDRRSRHLLGARKLTKKRKAAHKPPPPKEPGFRQRTGKFRGPSRARGENSSLDEYIDGDDVESLAVTAVEGPKQGLATECTDRRAR